MIAKNRGVHKGSHRSISKQIASRKYHRSVTPGTGGASKRSSKPYERLRPWFVIANLLPPAPSRAEVDRSPDDPVSMLLSRWEAECRNLSPTELVRRFEGSPSAHESANAAGLDFQLLRTDEREAQRFCGLVGEIASTLRALVLSPKSPQVLQAVGNRRLMIKRLYQAPATSRSEIWVCNGLVATSWVDPFKDFLTALAGVELARVRQCDVCAHLFFALRKDQKACSKRCNATRRVREWRANQAKHEYRRKLRGAGLLTRKKTRRRRS